MKDAYYKLLEFKSNLHNAFRAGVNRMKHPMARIQSWNWSNDDHSHFCLAAQILESEDFKAVCPHHGKIEGICWCDDCDYCKYQAIVDFNTDENGEKNISLYINDTVKTDCE